jgi:membrane protease YdiL (CAAX protease family)
MMDLGKDLFCYESIDESFKITRGEALHIVLKLIEYLAPTIALVFAFYLLCLAARNFTDNRDPVEGVPPIKFRFDAFIGILLSYEAIILLLPLPICRIILSLPFCASLEIFSPENESSSLNIQTVSNFIAQLLLPGTMLVILFLRRSNSLKRSGVEIVPELSGVETSLERPGAETAGGVEIADNGKAVKNLWRKIFFCLKSVVCTVLSVVFDVIFSAMFFIMLLILAIQACALLCFFIHTMAPSYLERPLSQLFGSIMALAACLLFGVQSNPQQVIVDLVMINVNKGLPFSLILTSIIVLGPITEEFVFRGFIYRVLKGHTGKNVANVCTAFLFASTHLNAGAFVLLFILGLWLGRRYERSGKISEVILMHSIFNLVNVSLILSH